LFPLFFLIPFGLASVSLIFQCYRTDLPPGRPTAHLRSLLKTMTPRPTFLFMILRLMLLYSGSSSAKKGSPPSFPDQKGDIPLHMPLYTTLPPFSLPSSVQLKNTLFYRVNPLHPPRNIPRFSPMYKLIPMRLPVTPPFLFDISSHSHKAIRRLHLFFLSPIILLFPSKCGIPPPLFSQSFHPVLPLGVRSARQITGRRPTPHRLRKSVIYLISPLGTIHLFSPTNDFLPPLVSVPTSGPPRRRL